MCTDTQRSSRTEARKTANRITKVYVAGSVRRYHANPSMAHLGQTNADHTARVVQIMLLLVPDTRVELLRAAVFHDVGEFWVGDLPSDVKHAYPDVAAAHKKIEDAALQNVLGCDIYAGLTEEELALLKLCDRLECIGYRRVSGLPFTRSWKNACDDCIIASAPLGLRTEVERFVDYCLRP